MVNEKRGIDMEHVGLEEYKQKLMWIIPLLARGKE